MKRKTLLAIEIALLAGLAVALGWGAGAVSTRREVSDKVVRLHVLANSDSGEDQALKYRVRDAVLGEITELVSTSADRSQAEGLIRGQLLELEALAAREIAAAGYDYAVTAQLKKMDFPTREYESFTLPAGNYLALQIVIGEGKGQNWWCVVFPSLCLPAAGESTEDVAAGAGFSEELTDTVTQKPNYRIRFFFMDVIGKIENLFFQSE